MSETISKGEQSNQVQDLSKENLFLLNCDKTKELVINYSRSNQDESFPSVYIEGKPISIVTRAKLLGVTINSKLSWNGHIEDLVKSAARKLYFLVQLKRARVPPVDLVAYYCLCIRSSIDYACSVSHYALPKYLREDLERLQKRALSCIFPGISYSTALARANISSIHDRHDMLTKKQFKALMDNPDCKLKPKQ